MNAHFYFVSLINPIQMFVSTIPKEKRVVFPLQSELDNLFDWVRAKMQFFPLHVCQNQMQNTFPVISGPMTAHTQTRQKSLPARQTAKVNHFSRTDMWKTTNCRPWQASATQQGTNEFCFQPQCHMHDYSFVMANYILVFSSIMM